MIYHFPKDTVFEGPQEFTDPFRYAPHPLVRLATAQVMERIEGNPFLSDAFAEGKMLGVLVCSCRDGELCYIAGFSGTVGGKSVIEGFVPPIFDLTDPEGHFRKEEARISRLNEKIAALTDSDRLKAARQELADCERDRDEELGMLRVSMQMAKRERDEIRMNCSDPDVIAGLVRESQFEKAEMRRLKVSWTERIEAVRKKLEEMESEISGLKVLRAEMSDRLQEWIFRQYIVHNALGEEASIADIFAEHGLVPSGGTGECAAPKMLEYAFRNGLKPLAMGEFWYGKASETAVRCHGRFYPACTSKCGPLLTYMLAGESLTMNSVGPRLRFAQAPPSRGWHANSIHPSDFRPSCTTPENNPGLTGIPEMVYEDGAVVVVEKPGGMPSVPGLDGRESLLEWLEARLTEVHAVHRLDMDTSGVMVFAKTHEAAVDLRRQFEEHTVRKTYLARLSAPSGPKTEGTTPPTSWAPPPAARGVARFLQPSDRKGLAEGAKGVIELPLSPDYDERPRQKVDMKQGKPAITDYEVVSVNEDCTADVIFHPVTGRTHQLRVHSAHSLGLGCPIVGDLLYGGHTAYTDGSASGSPRLHLHALSITFHHPETSEPLTFASHLFCYP